MKLLLSILGLGFVGLIGGAIGWACFTLGGWVGFAVAFPICVLVGVVYGRFAALFLWE